MTIFDDVLGYHFTTQQSGLFQVSNPREIYQELYFYKTLLSNALQVHVSQHSNTADLREHEGKRGG